MTSQIHDLVSNDPLLDPKVVPDELGQLGRPAERAGRAWPARASQPGGRASQAGRPGRLAGRWAASQEGNEGRAQEGAQRAGADGAPPLLSPQVGYFVRFCDMANCHVIYSEKPNAFSMISEAILRVWSKFPPFGLCFSNVS